MTKSVLTPVDRSTATVVDLANHVFRKEILRPSTIKYKGKQKTFSPAYIKGLKDSFDAQLYCDTVPAQLAPGDNAHTNDVERTGGRLTGVELTTDNRLVGVFTLNARGAAAVEDSDRLVGVSARIVEGASDANGKLIPPSMQHVLLTVDPRIRGLKPWEKVDLSEDDSEITETLDLSAAEFPGETEEKMGDTKTKDELVTVELSQDDATALVEMLADRKAAVELAAATAEAATKAKGKKTPKQIAFEKMMAAKKGGKAADDAEDEADGGDDEGDEKDTKLTAEEVTALELAQVTAESAEARVFELSRQLQIANADREVEKLLARGLAPAVVDLARPVLELDPQVVELANGETVDPGEVLRSVLNEVIALGEQGYALVDLAREDGTLQGDEQDQALRKAQLEILRGETNSLY